MGTVLFLLELGIYYVEFVGFVRICTPEYKFKGFSVRNFISVGKFSDCLYNDVWRILSFDQRADFQKGSLNP